MAKVMHGRRKGTQREKNTAPEYNTNAYQGGMMLPDGTDLRQVTVLSKHDWERIEQELNRRHTQNEMVRLIQQEREEQKRKSKEIIKNWNNTIAGQRQRKLEARRIREEKEEEERRLIDVEEALLQAQKRKEAIDQAKTQQYYQTDRVKNFHSALTLTEVLKERDAQLELKRLKELAVRDFDKDYMKIDRELYEKSIKDDQEKARVRTEAAQRTAEFQLAQVSEHLSDVEKQKLVDLKEGEELKKLTLKYRTEKNILDNMRKDEIQKVMKENFQQIEDVKTMKILHEKQEEEEDEECRVFATAKRKMMKLRAQKELDLQNEKQERLERIKDRLIVQMKQRINDDEDRFCNAVKDIETKHVAEERAKEEKLLKEIREQAEHRKKQLMEKEEKLKREKYEERELLEMRNAADELFRQHEIEKSVQQKEDAAKLRNFLVDQYNERVNKQEEAKRVQIALDKASVELLEKEEAQFQEYAAKVIDHCRKKGRNVYPLKRAAQKGAGGGGLGPTRSGKGGIQPSYLVSDQSDVQMPHYQCDSTEDTKLQINGKNPTKNRLGFVW